MDPSSGSSIQCLSTITVITVLLARHCIQLPDDGSLPCDQKHVGAILNILNIL